MLRLWNGSPKNSIKYRIFQWCQENTMIPRIQTMITSLHLGSGWFMIQDSYYSPHNYVTHYCSVTNNEKVIPGTHKICPGCEKPVPPEIEMIFHLKKFTQK